MNLVIRPARPADAAAIFRLVEAIAAYEKLTHEIDATQATMVAALFGPTPRVFCDLAEVDGIVVGFAVWFYSFSTFRGRHGLYLEDLFVDSAHRRAGLGQALLKTLARRCVDENLARMEWSVLDWNTPAIDFYRQCGAVLKDEWTTCRLDGDALDRLAA